MIPGIARLFPIWFRASDEVLFDSVPGTLAEIQANLDFAESVNGDADGRILPMMSPHATDTHTPETMAAILAGAKKLGNGVHIHLSQSGSETQTVERLWGLRPVPWLESLGFYSEPVFGAHMSGVDLVNDPPILAEHGVVYAHCPSAGGAGGGTQPYPELLAAGVPSNIGIDTHSNDYVENLKLAVLYGQARRSLIGETSPVPLANPTIHNAVAGATVVAADGLRRPDLGRIKVGAKADLTTVDVTGPLVGVGTLPPEPLHNLLYANGLSVRHAITDGAFQIAGATLVVDDEWQVREAGGAAATAVWDQLRSEGWFD